MLMPHLLGCYTAYCQEDLKHQSGIEIVIVIIVKLVKLSLAEPWWCQVSFSNASR